MIVEQLIFTVISFAIFVYMFLKMIRNNDTSYVTILVLEAVGIALNFVEVLFDVKLNIVFIILKYVFAILLPIVIIILEKRNVRLFEGIGLLKVKLLIMFGNTKKAKQILLGILEKNPNSYKAHLYLARLYEQEGGMRRAIDEYVHAIDLNKQDYESYYKVADLLNQLNKKDEAAQMLSNLLNKKPDNLEASELLGQILIEKEMYKEAANVYQEALKYSPLSYEINYNLGMVYTMLNDFQNAKICYEKAANINSLAYNSKYSLAEIALIYKDLEEAEKKFQEVLEDEELSADAYYELSKIYLMKGNKDIAIKYANTAIDVDSKKIVEKIKKDPIFIPIFAKLSIPFNLEEKEDETKNLSEIEIKSKEHLEEMVEITRSLSYQDIDLLKTKIHNKEKIIEQENEYEKDEKERH